jgi:hypothetical protein
MIRPITCVTLLLACGSGLYLYQVKHRVHVVDGQIEQVVRQTAQVREQIRLLRAEWTLLDQPDRLQQLAGQFLDLQPTKPTQFASPADLDSRLPAVPPPSQPEEPSVAAAPAPAEAPVAAAPPVVKQEQASVAAIAPPMPAPVHVAEHPTVPAIESPRSQNAAPRTPPAVPAAARPQIAAAQPVRAARLDSPAPAPARLVTAALPRPVPAAPVPAFRPVAAAPRASAPPPPAYGGSMLGMARAAAPPPPLPAPVWFNWNNR